MWIMGKDESYIDSALSHKYITEEEKKMILMTPQMR